MFDFSITSEFEKCTKELKISESVIDAIENWARTFNRAQTNKSKLFFSSPCKFEIWAIRIPDPDSNVGSSGGFRMVCHIVFGEDGCTDIIFVDRIERRKAHGGKNERPKDQAKYTKYLEELKKDLKKAVDS